MKRASLIVKVENTDGDVTGFTCESVHVNFDGTVTAFCSGKPFTVGQDQVKSIDYAPDGAEFCPWCDQSLSQFVRS